MSLVTKLFALVAGALAAVALFATPAVANTQVKSVIHVDETDVDSGTCAFDITFHQYGFFKNLDYY